MNKGLIVLLVAVFLQACTWVNLTKEGEQVRITSQQNVTNCKYLGKSHVSVKADVAGFARGPGKVQLELEVMARNEAAKVKGDTIVAITGVEAGRQSYGVYKCR